MKLKLLIIILIDLIVLAMCLIASFGCIHDMHVMQVYNDQMQRSIEAVIKKQEQQASQMRQVKTESEIMYRLAMDKLFVEEEE